MMPIDKITAGVVPGIPKGPGVQDNKQSTGETKSSLSQLKHVGQAGADIPLAGNRPLKINSTAYHATQSHNGRVSSLVMHYTALNFKDSIAVLTGPDVSVHYVVPDPTDQTYLDDKRCNGDRVIQLLPEESRAWHAGVSKWAGRSNINDTSIGIEIVNLASDDGQGNLTFPPFNEQQIDAVIQLSLNIIERHPDIKSTKIIGHSDIAPGRKSDPGAAFPWQQLSESGVGAWYEESTMSNYQKQFTAQMPAESEIIEKLAAYGYDVSGAGTDEGKKLLFQAFQLHFRQSNYAGEMDAETAAIIYALVDKYAAI